jgi:hypothetical protein
MECFVHSVKMKRRRSTTAREVDSLSCILIYFNIPTLTSGLHRMIWTELNCYITTDGQSPSLSWYQAPFWGLWPDFFNTVRYLRVCWYGAPSLTRGLVCLLQLLLSSPAQSFTGPSPAGFMTTFYCLRFETPPTWRIRSLYLYPPGTGWPGYAPRHWVILPSPLIPLLLPSY